MPQCKLCFNLYLFLKYYTKKSLFQNSSIRYRVYIFPKTNKNIISQRFFSWSFAMTRSVPTSTYKNEDSKIFPRLTF